MKFEVLVTPNSKLIVEADPSGRGPVEICACEVDLSRHDLFVQPLSVPGDETIESLKDKTIEVFRLLSFADLNKPFLRALEIYYEKRLPDVFRQLESGASHDPSLINKPLSELRDDPHRAQQVLGRIVQRVDAEFPYAYRTEKSLGTYPWLSSGGSKSLPFLLAPRSTAPLYRSLFVPAKPAEDHIPFAIEEGIAFHPDQKPPNPSAVLASLCATGKLGSSVDFLNQAAAMSVMTKPISHDIERARHTTELQSSLISPAQQTFLACSAITLLLGISGAACTAQAIINILDSGLALPHIALGAVGGALGMISWIAQRVVQAVQTRRRDCDTLELARATATLEETKMVPHTVLSSVLLNHLSRGDSSGQRSFPGPESARKWQAIFEDVAVPDHNIRQDMTLVPIDPEEGHNSLERHVTQRIMRELRQKAAYLHHLEAAQRHGQLLLAIDTANFFNELIGGRCSPQTQLPLRQLLSGAQQMHSDRDGSFPLISQTFENVCRSLRLSREDWAFASRPLYAVYLLESELAQRAAQRIALEEVLKA